MERRLSAILAADMVGYSRLIEADEIGTLERQKLHRKDLIDPTIREGNGRIDKEMGDGVLVEFPSVVQAIECAVTIQRSMAMRESELDENLRIRYRVGINLGDVIVEGNDIYGDGVNVAARLEQLAEPGGVCISGAAYDTAQSTVDAGFESLGKVQVKNIARQIRAYKVVIETTQASETEASSQAPITRRRRNLALFTAAITLAVAGVGSALIWTHPWLETTSGVRSTKIEILDKSDKPSIAVLPFANTSNDDTQDYFTDGLTQDVITDLSKVSGLFVIASGSSFRYRNRESSVTEVGQELGVSHILTGSVRKSGELVRINAQLVEVASGKHIWGARYDGGLSEVFSLQDEVTNKIVKALQVQLTETEKATVGGRYTDSVEAYDAFLKGRRELARVNQPGNLASRPYFKTAIRLDPTFANAYAFLAWSFVRGYAYDWDNEPGKSLSKAAELAQRGVELDRDKSTPYLILGQARLYQLRHAEAVASIETALKYNPNNADVYAMLAFVLNYSGFADKANDLMKNAMELNPHYSYLYLVVLGQSKFLLQEYDEATRLFSEAANRNPDDNQVTMWLAASYAQTGLLDEAQWAVTELLTQNENYTISDVVSRIPFKTSEQADIFARSLKLAGMPD